MDENERLDRLNDILREYYFEQRTQNRIAKKHDLSKSQVSRLINDEIYQENRDKLGFTEEFVIKLKSDIKKAKKEAAKEVIEDYKDKIKGFARN